MVTLQALFLMYQKAFLEQESQIHEKLVNVANELADACKKGTKNEVQKLYYRSHTRSLRSVSNELLLQPRSYTKTYGDRAFAVHAPGEWNLIPYEIRKSNTISSFKRSLKTYLFTKFSNNGSLFL